MSRIRTRLWRAISAVAAAPAHLLVVEDHMSRYVFAGAAVVVVFAVASVDAQMITPGVDEAFNGGLSSPSREAPRVMQSFIDNSFLSDVTTPTTISGLSFRLPGIANLSYPALGDLNFTRYEITLAEASAAAAAANALTSDTFADNMSNAVLVRSGALNVPLGSFTDNSTGPGPDGSAEFSFVIPFTTNYVIQPGQDLVVLLRHNGHGDLSGVETRWNFDSFTYVSGGRVATGNVDAASGSLVPDTVVKYGLVVVPEPSALALLGAGALMTLRRRRA